MTDQWQDVQRVLGYALISRTDDRIVDDVFLMGRIIALVKSGRLEIQGELGPEMHKSRVRLSGTQ